MAEKKILILRTDRVGDLIFSIPAILTIKNYFTNSKISLISSSKNFKYANESNIFEKIFIYPKKNIFNKIKFFYKLSKEKYDYIFMFDGKGRSLLPTLLTKSRKKFAIYPLKKIKFFFRYFNINITEDNGIDSINDLFQKMMLSADIKTDIKNYDFLKQKKFLRTYKISIDNYIHLHFDEKWFNYMYFNNLTQINPTENDFINFIKNILLKNNVLITTGVPKIDLIEKIKNTFFTSHSENVHMKTISDYSVILVENTNFTELESLLKNSKLLISCHGSLIHCAASLEIRFLDIYEKSQKDWYLRWTKHIKNYNYIYRENFNKLSDKIINFI